MKTPYTITECERQIAAYNRYSSSDFLQQQKERWQKRLEEATETAIELWRGIMEWHSTPELLLCASNQHNPYQAEAACLLLQEDENPNRANDDLCPDCDLPFDGHTEHPASWGTYGGQPAELACPRHVPDADLEY